MSYFLSVIAIIVSLAALLVPYLDKNFRRGILIAKLERKAVKYMGGDKVIYHFAQVPLSWGGTCYHLMPEVVNGGTHKLSDYYLTKTDVKSVVMHVVLRNYKMINEGTYKLLLEDPTESAWTDYVKIDRDFLEKNLDYIIRVEAEFVSKQSTEGVTLFNPDSTYKYLIQPTKVEATGYYSAVMSSPSNIENIRISR